MIQHHSEYAMRTLLYSRRFETFIQFVELFYLIEVAHTMKLQYYFSNNFDNLYKFLFSAN